MSTRAADFVKAQFEPGGQELSGGLTCHLVGTLPPQGSKRQQTLFDVGEIGSLRITIYVDALDQLGCRLHLPGSGGGQLSIGGIYDGYLADQHVHFGAQAEPRQDGVHLTLYYQGQGLSAGWFKGSLGTKLVGGTSFGHDLDGANHVVKFYVAEVRLWVRPLSSKEITDLWVTITRKYQNTLAATR